MPSETPFHQHQKLCFYAFKIFNMITVTHSSLCAFIKSETPFLPASKAYDSMCLKKIKVNQN